jgi:transcription elongation factor GreA
VTRNAITREGLARLLEELERLRTIGRAEITERIRQAAATETNRAENTDYLHARDEQALLERRIAILEERVGAAVIVEPDLTNGVVDVGELVRLRSLETGEEVEYVLVGSHEADPSQGRVSAVSPLGRALIGLEPGEIAVVDAPRGRLRFEVLAIEDALAADAAAA